MLAISLLSVRLILTLGLLLCGAYTDVLTYLLLLVTVSDAHVIAALRSYVLIIQLKWRLHRLSFDPVLYLILRPIF